jgi:REP-associated tyrosine transposase
MFFGAFAEGKMRLNEYGNIVERSWSWLAEQYPYVENYIYSVMPNHFHGILQIMDINDVCRGGSRPAPTTIIKPLGQLIGAFKTISAKQINLVRSLPRTPIWQRNYYEHILRNQPELEKITQYMLSYPDNWVDDPEYHP